MYRLPHEKKMTGLPQIKVLTHSLRDLTSLSQVLPPSRVCSTSGEKRAIKHGISIVLKLVSIEYQKRDVFLAAL